MGIGWNIMPSWNTTNTSIEAHTPGERKSVYREREKSIRERERESESAQAFFPPLCQTRTSLNNSAEVKRELSPTSSESTAQVKQRAHVLPSTPPLSYYLLPHTTSVTVAIATTGETIH